MQEQDMCQPLKCKSKELDELMPNLIPLQHKQAERTDQYRNKANEITKLRMKSQRWNVPEMTRPFTSQVQAEEEAWSTQRIMRNLYPCRMSRHSHVYEQLQEEKATGQDQSNICHEI